MLAFARFVVLAFVILTVIFGSLWFYLRARRRALIEEDYDSEPQTQDRDAYMEERIAWYDRSRFRLLILTVYVLPCATVLLIIYLTNYH